MYPRKYFKGGTLYRAGALHVGLGRQITLIFHWSAPVKVVHSLS